MKRPEKKEVMSYDNLDLNDCIKYVGDIEGAKGYNQAIEESDAYYEELLGGLKKMYFLWKKGNPEDNDDLGVWDDIESIAKELNWSEEKTIKRSKG